MLSNDKLPPYKWAIVYFNRFVPMLLAFCGLLYLVVDASEVGGRQIRNLGSYVVLILGGILIKEILYQSREKIYRLGESRFYFLAIIFYLSWLMNAFIAHDFNKDVMHWSWISWQANMKEFTPLNYMDLSLLVFAPAIGVIWYIFDVEFDRAKRRDMDIKALLIDEAALKHWNQQMIDISAVFFVLIMLLYSIPLGIICLFLIITTRFLDKCYSQWVNLGIAVCGLILSLKFNVEIINMAYAWFKYGNHAGWLRMVKAEFTIMPFRMGVTFIAAWWFAIAAFAELRLKQADLQKIFKYAKQTKIEADADGDIQFGCREDNGQEINLTDDELNYHALYLGTTGAGKTTAILNNIEHCAKMGIPCIELDGKGSPDLPEKIKQIADKYGRTFKLFTLKPESIQGNLKECLAAYHPFSTGTFTEFKNRIMSLFSAAEGRGQQHYVIGEENAINTVLAVLQKSGHDFDLYTLYHVIQDITILKALAIKTGDSFLIDEVELLDGEKIGDVGKILKLFILSSFGQMFNTRASDNVIKLQESIINNEIVLFMFDSSTYKEDTKKIAKLVINDINSSFSTMMDNYQCIKKCYCIFDEFASYASSNLSDTLTLHRSNGLHAIVGTQGLETVSLANSESARVAEELIACCGTFLILQLQHEGDIERVANLMGTRKSYEVTRQIDISEGQGATGMGSSKEVNEYIVHPSLIRELKGKDLSGILYRKSFGQQPFKIILRRIKFD